MPVRDDASADAVTSTRDASAGRRRKRVPTPRSTGRGPARSKKTSATARGRRKAGRQPPAHIRVLAAPLDDRDREAIARKLQLKLGKFAASIERVTLRVSDVNGPKGGVDHRCLIKVVLGGLPSVVVERRDSDLQRAVNGAIGSAVQSVRRSVQRRRLKPLHRRSSRSAKRTS